MSQTYSDRSSSAQPHRTEPRPAHSKAFILSLALSALCPLAPSTMALAQSGKPKPPKSQSPSNKVPNLGDEVPAVLLKSPIHTCDTGESRQEPCAVLTLHTGRVTDRVTVAWDSTTKRITYLYSGTLATDDDLRAGDLLPIASDLPVTPFPSTSIPHRFVSADWCDTYADLSHDALWCAVMVPVRPRSGKVLGFVQSIYLDLPNPDAPLLHRTANPRPPHPSRVHKTSILESP